MLDRFETELSELMFDVNEESPMRSNLDGNDKNIS